MRDRDNSLIIYAFEMVRDFLHINAYAKPLINEYTI